MDKGDGVLSIAQLFVVVVRLVFVALQAELLFLGAAVDRGVVVSSRRGRVTHGIGILFRGGVVARESRDLVRRVWDERSNHEGQDNEQGAEDEGRARDDVGHHVVGGLVVDLLLCQIHGWSHDPCIVVAFFCEVHVEEREDEAEHGRAKAVAETAHARDHALYQTLLVRIGVHGNEGRNRWVRDAGNQLESRTALKSSLFPFIYLANMRALKNCYSRLSYETFSFLTTTQQTSVRSCVLLNPFLTQKKDLDRVEKELHNKMHERSRDTNQQIKTNNRNYWVYYCISL